MLITGRAESYSAMVLIGLITFMFGDLTGNHPIRAGRSVDARRRYPVCPCARVALVSRQARRPHRADESRELGRRDSVVAIISRDQPALYERAVRAFGAAQVLYDRRLDERRCLGFEGRVYPPHVTQGLVAASSESDPSSSPSQVSGPGGR